MTLSLMFGTVITVWLITMLACGVSLRWSASRAANREFASYLLATFSAMVGLVGMTRFSIVASHTTNGVVQWRFDSAWLFWCSLICGLLCLGYAFFRRCFGTVEA